MQEKTPASLILAAPLGSAGLLLFFSRLLPEVGSPVSIPGYAENWIALGVWVAGAILVYVSLVVQNRDLRALPAGRIGPVWVLQLLLIAVLHGFLLCVVGGVVSALAGIPFWILMAGVSALANPDALSPGSYLHRVTADLLLVASVGGMAAGLRAVFRRPRKFSKWVWAGILCGLAIGCLSMSILASMARFKPDGLKRLYYPELER